MWRFDWKLWLSVGFQHRLSSAMNIATGNDSPENCTRICSFFPRGVTLLLQFFFAFKIPTVLDSTNSLTPGSVEMVEKSHFDVFWES
ncbi:hypothetical protein IW262DRAFT_272179 [Armillaria fumosa]|nr:hypothetical protein IW262DRAFT_272179 [Armillaria fumosa]